MLFSESYTIMANKVTLLLLGGEISPSGSALATWRRVFFSSFFTQLLLMPVRSTRRCCRYSPSPPGLPNSSTNFFVRSNCASLTKALTQRRYFSKVSCRPGKGSFCKNTSDWFRVSCKKHFWVSFADVRVQQNAEVSILSTRNLACWK